MNALIKVESKKKITLKSFINVLILICVSSVLSFVIIRFNKDFFNLHNKKIFYSLTIAFSFINVFMTYVLVKFVILNKKLEFHKKYFFVALYIGLFFMILTPFGNGADELSHFQRIYEISNGHFFTPFDGEEQIPESIENYIKAPKKNSEFSYAEFKTYMFSKLEPENKIDVKYAWVNTSLYAPIQYIPQTIGVFIGRILNLPIGVIGYLGRICGFIAWLLITTYAIKIVPNKKVFFATIMLLPIGIGYAVCLSGDTILNAAVLILICYIYKLWECKNKINKKEYYTIFMLSAIISLCKVVYLPIILAILFIPTECFKDKKDKFKKLGVIISVSGILALTWYKISSIYLNGYYGKSSGQIEYILKNPIEYIAIMIRTIARYFLVFMQYSSRVDMPPIISFAFWMITIMCLFASKSETRNITKKQKLWYIFIAISTTILIETAIYVQFTAMTVSVGSQVVDGIQSRYFIPIIILAGLVVNKKRLDVKEENLFISLIVLYLFIFTEVYKYYLI